MNKGLQNLKKSSSLLIISALESSSLKSFDYKVILIKRSKKMRTWPGLFVFPGGRLDSIDESYEWLSVFFKKKQSDERSTFKNIFKTIINENSIGNRFNLFNNNVIKSEKKLPAEISLRLCAIRETFEETGLLIADEYSVIRNESERISTCYKKNHAQLKEWRNRIKNSPEDFPLLFKELNLFPNLNGMHEWANWITPKNEKNRYDTIFFICFLKKMSNVQYYFDQDEVESIEELCPDEALKKFDSNEINLLPPQIYELKRLLRFKEFSKLSEYSQQRQSYGLKQWLPKFNKDFTFGVLPGDFMYESIDELDERSNIDLSYRPDNNVSTNRIVRENKKDQFKIESNIHLDGIQKCNT